MHTAPHFRDLPFSARTQSALDATREGDRVFWFDCDGTITHHLPVPDADNETNRVAGSFAFGYACAYLGLIEEGYGRYTQLRGQLDRKEVTHDAFFSLTELECLIPNLHEDRAIINRLDITRSELHNLRRQRGLEPDAPIPMDAEVMAFLGYKMGAWISAHGLYDTETLAFMHHVQNTRVEGGTRPVFTDVITAAPEDFNTGLTHALIDHYNHTQRPEPPLQYPRHVLGKQFHYQPDGRVSYAHQMITQADGPTDFVGLSQPESLRKWYLMEAFEAKGARIIGMAGDSMAPGRGDDAGLYIARDHDGKMRTHADGSPVTAHGGGLGIGGSYASKRINPETGQRYGVMENMSWVLREVARMKAEKEGVTPSFS